MTTNLTLNNGNVLLRSKTFETNSSSAHSLVFISGVEHIQLPHSVLDSNGEIHINLDKLPSYTNQSYTTPLEKLAYIMRMYFNWVVGWKESQYEKGWRTFQAFLYTLKEYTQADAIYFDYQNTKMCVVNEKDEFCIKSITSHSFNVCDEVKEKYKDRTQYIIVDKNNDVLPFVDLENHDANPMCEYAHLHNIKNEDNEDDWKANAMDIVFNDALIFSYDPNNEIKIHMPEATKKTIRQNVIQWLQWAFKRKGYDIPYADVDELLADDTLLDTVFIKESIDDVPTYWHELNDFDEQYQYTNFAKHSETGTTAFNFCNSYVFALFDLQNREYVALNNHNDVKLSSFPFKLKKDDGVDDNTLQEALRHTTAMQFFQKHNVINIVLNPNTVKASYDTYFSNMAEINWDEDLDYNGVEAVMTIALFNLIDVLNEEVEHQFQEQVMKNTPVLYKLWEWSN